jgi:diguanylate cyclase (GGDEF)-like protein
MAEDFEKYLLLHDLVRSLVWDDEIEFFERLEEEIRDDMGIDTMAISELREGSWHVLYTGGSREGPEDRPFDQFTMTKEALPAFVLTPGGNIGYDAHFSIMCQDAVRRLLSVSDAHGRRSFRPEEINALITIAHTVAVLLDNKRMLKEDRITGLPNRRTCERKLESCMQRARRYGVSFSVVMLDLDHFKRVNDTYGHDMGDQVLRAVADHLRHALRLSDFVGRWGGEEFLLVLEEAHPVDAQIRMERIRDEVKKHVFHAGPDSFHTSFSAGIALLSGDAKMDATTVSRADVALYAAKKGGRDRVEVDPHSLNTGELTAEPVIEIEQTEE